jgi:hypothetical protein
MKKITVFKCKYSRREAKELGKLLDSYMRFRAEQEGVAYELTSAFFEGYILAGFVCVFNVEFTKGKLVADAEFPAIFQKWTEKQQCISNDDSKRCEDGETHQTKESYDSKDGKDTTRIQRRRWLVSCGNLPIRSIREEGS